MGAAEEWEWPAEPTDKYNWSTFKVPSRIDTHETPAPTPQPKLLRRTAPQNSEAQQAKTAIANYSWTDLGLQVKIYVPAPSVTKQDVTCDFAEQRVTLKIQSQNQPMRILDLQRLYDAIHPPTCSCKVQDGKERVVLVLAKAPRKSTFDPVREWPTLHFGSGNGAAMSNAHVSHVAAGGFSRKSYDDKMLGMPKLPTL